MVGATTGAGRAAGRAAPALVAALLALPFAAALAGHLGDRWFVVGDWASIHLRTGAVGTADTPLVGAYSTRGWAHPGPVLYWVAAPLHRLSGGDPRSLFATAALVNGAAALAAVATARRVSGRAVAGAVALGLVVLACGLGPTRTVDPWNPLLPLFPLAYCTTAAWAVAVGHRRVAVPGLVVGALVAQVHVGLVPRVSLLVAWAVAVAVADRHRPDEGQPRWGRVLAAGGAGAALAWLPVAVDQVAGQRNMGRLVAWFAGSGAQPVGLARGAGLVARHVRPDGPWRGGPEPHRLGSVTGSSPWVLVAVVVALAAVGWASRRRERRDVALGCGLAATLVVGSVPIATQLDEVVFEYLVKWLEVVGAVAWTWLAAGAWVLVAPHLGPAARRAAPVAGLAALAVASLWSVPAAVVAPLPAAREAPVVEDLWRQLRTVLPRDRAIRVEHRGDGQGLVAAGLIVHLLDDGFAVVSSDGSLGHKYGPNAVWEPGDPPAGEVLTVAVHYPLAPTDALRECRAAGAAPLAEADSLGRAERAELEELNRRRAFHPGRATAADHRRADALGARSVRAAVFRSATVCAGGR